MTAQLFFGIGSAHEAARARLHHELAGLPQTLTAGEQLDEAFLLALAERMTARTPSRSTVLGGDGGVDGGNVRVWVGHQG